MTWGAAPVICATIATSRSARLLAWALLRDEDLDFHRHAQL
jgi:hypothetical protein